MIIACLSLFHITLAYFFLTSPGTLADQTLVFIIGESMGMVNPCQWVLSSPISDNLQPESRAFERQSAPLAFLAAILFVVGITDLVSVSLPEEISQYHWGSQGQLHFGSSAQAFANAAETSARTPSPLLHPILLLLLPLRLFPLLRNQNIQPQHLGRRIEE